MPPVRFSSVAQSCLTLCNPMECSAPGLPVHHQLPELAQNHVHRVGDAIQPSHPLSCPLAFSLSQHHGLFFRLVYLCKFLNIFIGVSLLYSVVLFSAVKQSESVIHIPPLFWIYFLFQWGTEEEAMWTRNVSRVQLSWYETHSHHFPSICDLYFFIWDKDFAPQLRKLCIVLAECLYRQWSGSEVAQSSLTLSDPMDCSSPGSSVHGTLQARIPFPSPRYAVGPNKVSYYHDDYKLNSDLVTLLN